MAGAERRLRSRKRQIQQQLSRHQLTVL